MSVARNSSVRITGMIALAFGVLALLAALVSVFVLGSRPWGCSASSSSPAVTCDWVTSRWVAGIWLIAALGICVVSWKRWTLALAAISLVLMALGLVSVVGLYTLAPGALWFACVLWLWSSERRLLI